MIIRELVSSFGIDFDETGAKQAERSMQRLDNTFNAIGLGLSFAGVYSGLKSVLGLSSSAEEQANVLGQTFGAFSNEVTAWADVNAKAMSRSSADLQKYAGQLGAVIEPMLGNKQAAAEMSQSLAGLSVDLGSFFEKGDEETMERLRSGLLGSSEAVDQLGINLREEHVQAVMAEKGLKGKFKTMAEGEKVQMRFLTIMKDTKDKQGDAARTAGSYANRQKAAEASTKDLGKAIGDKLMPVTTSAIGLFTDFSSGLLDIVKTSNAVEVGMVGLAGAASLTGVMFTVAHWSALLAIAGFTAFGLAIEDVYTGLEGGESYFADFYKWARGEEEWKEVIATWKNAKANLSNLGNDIYDSLHPEDARLRGREPRPAPTGLFQFMARTLLGDGSKGAAHEGRPGPGIQQNSTPVDGRSSWTDMFGASSAPAEVYKGERGMSRNYGRRPLSFESDQVSRYAGREALPFGAQSEASFSGVVGAMQSFASSVGELSGVVQGIPANAIHGAPMSLPASTVTNNHHTVNNAGDIQLNVGAGASPDTLREAKRAARELMEDQNRSLVDSASSR